MRMWTNKPSYRRYPFGGFLSHRGPPQISHFHGMPIWQRYFFPSVIANIPLRNLKNGMYLLNEPLLQWCQTSDCVVHGESERLISRMEAVTAVSQKSQRRLAVVTTISESYPNIVGYCWIFTISITVQVSKLDLHCIFPSRWCPPSYKLVIIPINYRCIPHKP